MGISLLREQFAKWVAGGGGRAEDAAFITLHGKAGPNDFLVVKVKDSCWKNGFLKSPRSSPKLVDEVSDA
jgi:hypothetical protein